MPRVRTIRRVPVKPLVITPCKLFEVWLVGVSLRSHVGWFHGQERCSTPSGITRGCLWVKSPVALEEFRSAVLRKIFFSKCCFVFLWEDCSRKVWGRFSFLCPVSIREVGCEIFLLVVVVFLAFLKMLFMSLWRLLSFFSREFGQQWMKKSKSSFWWIWTWWWGAATARTLFSFTAHSSER